MPVEASGWTESREARLKDLTAQDMSASDIARELGGGLSRNAVIGKVNRMGLQLFRGGSLVKPAWVPRSQRPGYVPKPRAPRPARERRRTPRVRDITAEAERRQRAATAQDRYSVIEVVDLQPEDRARAVHLLDLKDHHCRWPLGDPRDLDAMRFCGDTADPDRPYCAHHCRMAYVTVAVANG